MTTEHGEQEALFAWAAWQVNLGNEPLSWMFAIPNGGLRNKKVAIDLKAEGVKPGVCDVFLPYPLGGYCGLFIEMKIKGNKPTLEQLAYIEWLNDVGYLAVVAYGCNEAIAIIEKYLELGRNKPHQGI